jgi:hypothetical protein
MSRTISSLTISQHDIITCNTITLSPHIRHALPRQHELNDTPPPKAPASRRQRSRAPPGLAERLRGARTVLPREPARHALLLPDPDADAGGPGAELLVAVAGEREVAPQRVRDGGGAAAAIAWGGGRTRSIELRVSPWRSGKVLLHVVVARKPHFWRRPAPESARPRRRTRCLRHHRQSPSPMTMTPRGTKAGVCGGRRTRTPEPAATLRPSLR